MKPPRKSENELILGLVSVSDRASRGVYDDRGIPELEAWCRKAIINPMVVHKRLIPDERFEIEKTLRELVDIIGALPKRDERDYGRGDEAFDIIMETAKSRNKMVHVHVDQFNESLEYETEQLCEKTIQHGMQGKVVAIHGISIAAHSRAYRQRLYTLMREADVMMIACPTAWIDTPRSEQIGPMHNSMTPVDELVPAGITVALGTDNVCDAMVPWNAGDMWHEMTTLATGCRFDYFDELVKIATVNGRKAIGID